MMKKKPYPHNSDIMYAIRKALSIDPFVNPLDFPELVRRVLEEEGFYVGLVSDRRIWNLYVTMVRKGMIYDYLNVVKIDELG